MRLIQIRDVPEAIYRRLIDTAQEERRSLSQQVLTVLSQALETEADPVSRRRALIAKIEKSERRRPKRLPDPAKLIREDRRR